MDDGMRAGLRALVRRAEWAAPAGGRKDAEACARRLREVGRELATRVAGSEDRDTWAYRATTELAAHCARAVASWSVDDVAELARLRGAAMIALAPAPGETDVTSGEAETSPPPPGRSRLTLPGGRRTAVIGLGVIGCAAVLGIVVAGQGGGGSGHPSAVASLPTASASQQPVGLSSFDSTSSTATGPTDPAPTGSAPTGSASAESSAAGGTARVTAIKMTATPADGYPEVQIYGTITASGTGDLAYTVAVAGTSGAPQVSTEDESGQTSYALSQTIYLQPWCGQKSVTVTVSSGGVSSSASVPVTGC
jgi:hypothetical protein